MKNVEQRLRAENEELKDEVRELKETLGAISSGEVDAIVVTKADEKKIYTLENADQPYRVLIENIQEGALTLSHDGMILYGNTAFARMRGVPLPDIIGTNLQQHIIPRDKDRFEGILCEVIKRPVRSDMTICSGNGSFPVLLSMTALNFGGDTKISAVVTDRREDYDRLLLQSRMLDGVADAVIAIGPDEKILYWNDAATKIYGWRREEVIGHNLTSVAAPDKKSRTILEKLKRGQTWSGEYIVKHKDGHLFPVFARDSPIFDDEGRLLAVLGASNDITERKRAEEALREAQTRTSTVLERIAEAFYSLDDQWRFVTVNPAAEKAPFGRPASELLGRVIWDLYPSLLGTDIHRHYLNAAKKHNLEHYTAQSPLNGRWYEVFMYGRTVGVDVYMRDITERKQAEEALRKSEEEYRLLVEYAPAAIYEISYDGLRFKRVNNAMCSILGYTRDELLGMNPFDVLDEQSKVLFRERIRKRLEGEEIDESVVYGIRARDGRELWVTLNIKQSHEGGTLVIAHDITERKRAEEYLKQKHTELNVAYEKLTSTQEQLRQNIEELSKREHELNEALREKEILLSEVHHRVKNNLTAFISLLSLESAYDESLAGLALKKDLQNRARSMALIHETLYRTKKYSRVDMEVYLSTLAGQVVSSYESAKSIQTFVDASSITLDLSRATPCGLIINELLTNSLKYAFPASFDCDTIRGAPCRIEVNLMEDAGSYILTVRDNGIGLPGDLNIATIKTLGLKLVNFLAKHQLRASIEVHSDEGAEFRFRFRDKM